MTNIFEAIRALAQTGLGVDDICVKLKINDRESVRRIVFAGYPAEVISGTKVVRIA